MYLQAISLKTLTFMSINLRQCLHKCWFPLNNTLLAIFFKKYLHHCGFLLDKYLHNRRFPWNNIYITVFTSKTLKRFLNCITNNHTQRNRSNFVPYISFLFLRSHDIDQGKNRFVSEIRMHWLCKIILKIWIRQRSFPNLSETTNNNMKKLAARQDKNPQHLTYFCQMFLWQTFSSVVQKVNKNPFVVTVSLHWFLLTWYPQSHRWKRVPQAKIKDLLNSCLVFQP